jgi:hypothetical protein
MKDTLALRIKEINKNLNFHRIATACMFFQYSFKKFVLKYDVPIDFFIAMGTIALCTNLSIMYKITYESTRYTFRWK